MTTAQRIKDALIDYLTINVPDESITVTDANARTVIEMPALAVDIQGSQAHSPALSMVNRAEVALVLRAHSGDEPEADIPAWIDQIESLLFDSSVMLDVINGSNVMIYEWIYNGSTQAWDEAVLEVSFSASVLFARQ